MSNSAYWVCIKCKFGDVVVCSQCGVEPRGGWSGLTPYCAYCGAKMKPDTVYEEVQEEK
jgi:NAD-dependent SIR2 family protein deacetylase